MSLKKRLRGVSMLVDNTRYALGARKPYLLYKLARNHLLTRMGTLVPRSICFAVDYRCNLTCEHCSARNLENRDRPQMTLADYRRVAGETEALRFFNIQFTGGEPLLRTDLEEIVSCFHPRRNFILISTNATLMDLERARSLRRAGVDVLSVSLDSSDAGTHDLFRRKEGAWEKALAGIEAAHRGGLRVSVNAVVTHQNIRSDDLEELAQLTRKLGCGMQLGWACPVGAWAGNREARLTEEDMDDLFRFLDRHHHARTDFDGNYRHRGCPAVKEMMYVTAHGDYLPCAFIPISYGNLREEPLATLRDRALEDPFYQRYWNRCLSASNEEFYEKYLVPTFDAPSPLPHTELEHAPSPEPART
jgi:MoaA/NifB/PqqE/SkfB family radical SAM enzyme